MKVSIIIPVYNRLKYTKKCLESIFLFDSKYDFETIVVDNASADDTAEYLKKLENKLNGRIIVIHNKKNLGFAKACNQGGQMAKGEYVLFLNNDTVITKGWLDVLVTELDHDESVAIVGPKLLYPDNTIQHAGIVFYENKVPVHIYKRENKDADCVNKKRVFQALTGACLMIRRSIFDKVGGFDEIYKNGLEDVDLCLKVKYLGLKAVYCPESIVYHYESLSKGRSEHDDENAEIFMSRWASKIHIDYTEYALVDGTDGLGKFLANQIGKNGKTKRLLYLAKTFCVVMWRDGYSIATKKAMRRIR